MIIMIVARLIIIEAMKIKVCLTVYCTLHEPHELVCRDRDWPSTRH